MLLKADVFRRVVLLFCAVQIWTAAAEIPQAAKVNYGSDDYVGDSLVLQLDGIDNAGRGTNDTTSTVFKDLAGSCDFTVSSDGSFDGNSFVYSGRAAVASKNTPSYNTIEIVYELSSACDGYVFHTGISRASQRCVFHYSTGSRIQFGNTLNSTAAIDSGSFRDLQMLAATYDGNDITPYRDAEVVPLITSTQDWNPNGNAAIGGRSGGCYTYGRIYAVRLHSRALTQEELAYNRAVDRCRFFNDRSGINAIYGCVLGIRPIPQQRLHYGETIVPEVVITNTTTGALLEEGRDYTLAYTNNAAPGSAKITVTGIGDYAGECNYLSFDIVCGFTAADYSTDGLVNMWDGLENAGPGVHDLDATVWKDLAGDLDFTLTANGSWRDNCFVVNGSSAAAARKTCRYRTIEVVFERTKRQNTFDTIFYSGHQDRMVVGYQDNQIFFSTRQSDYGCALTNATVTELDHFAATYNGYAADAPGHVTGLYRDGAAAEALAGNNPDNMSLNAVYACLGTRGNGNTGFAKIYAIRLYDRELTADEIARHYAIDRARFFGDLSHSDGYIQRLAVAPVAPVTTEGEPLAEPELEVTDTVTGDPLVKGVDYTVRFRDNGYPGTAKAYVTGIGDYAGQITALEFEVEKIRTADYRAENYVHDGLVMQLDGIDNTGTGVHDASATVWKDLVGQRDFTLSANGGWTDKAFTFSGLSASAAVPAPDDGVTIEAVMRVESIGGGILFYSNHQSCDLMMHASDVLAFSLKDGTMSQIAAPGFQIDQQVAAIMNGKDVVHAYRDAEEVEVSNQPTLYNNSTAVAAIGARANGQYGGTGRFYTIRIYNRALTEEEIRFNYSVDRARFFGDYSAFCDYTVEPIDDQIFDGVHAVTPEPVVRAKTGELLVKGVDYELVYADNEASGIAIVTVKGKGARIGMDLPVRFEVRIPVLATPDESADGDGTSWANAMNLKAALAAASAGDVVIVRAGSFTLTEPLVASVPVSVLGGFAGNDADPFAKAANGERTEIDGADAVDTVLAIDGTAPGVMHITIEDLVLKRGIKRGFAKIGNSSVTMRRCDFRMNGTQTTDSIKGRGAYLTGTTDSTAEVTDCRFEGNLCDRMYIDYTGGGCGLYAETFGQGMTIANCAFVTNGLGTAVTPTHVSSGHMDMIGAALYVKDSPLEMSGCEFRANRGSTRTGSAYSIVYIKGRNATVKHCLFAGNSMTVGSTSGFGSNYGVLEADAVTLELENCTFAYNMSDSTSCGDLGLVNGTHARIRNSIFYGYKHSTGSMSRISSPSGNYLDIDYCLLEAGLEDGAIVFGRASETALGAHICYDEPEFVTTAGDFAQMYEKRGDNRWWIRPAAVDAAATMNLSVRNSDGVYSAAIDSGDPAEPVGDEPVPNGGRLNLGYYAGTANAATSAADVPSVDDLALTWPNNESLPLVSLSLAGAEGALYNADVEIYCATGAEIAAESFVNIGERYNLHRGAEIVQKGPYPYHAGDSIRVMTVVKTGGNLNITNILDGTVAGEFPRWYGTGGGEGIIHVWSDSPLPEDGTGWASAWHTLAAAFADAKARGIGEIWIGGDFTTELAIPSFAPDVPTFIRGGFAVGECAADERPEGTVSTLDGNNTPTTIMTIANGAGVPVMIERVAFTRAYHNALTKTGAGDIVLDSCRVIRNGTADCNFQGHGFVLTGSASTTAVITNCYFAGQNYAAQSAGGHDNGTCIHATTFEKVIVADSLFVTNGALWTMAVAASSAYRNTDGMVAYLVNAPLELRGSEFRANRCCARNGYGALVTLSGACGGSIIENCLFAGNENIFGDAGGSQLAAPSAAGGCIAFKLTDATTEAIVKNCSFIGNICDSSASAAGVSIVSGKVSIRNSLFHGNLLGMYSGLTGRDIAFGPDGDGAVSFSMFDESAADSISYGVNHTPQIESSSLRFGDPHIAVDPGTNGIVTTGSLVYYNRDWATVATLLTIDAHLKSKAGYWLDDGTYVASGDAQSAAIDGGYSSDDCSKEPSPNGGVVNIGCYGNTARASKTMIGQPEIDGIAVEFPDGESRPKVTVTLTGDSDAEFAATVMIVCRTGSVVVAETSVPGVVNGGSAVFSPLLWLDDGTPFSVSVTVTAYGAELRESAENTTVEGDYPSWYGKGGGESIIHVWSGAVLEPNGTSWGSAYRSLMDAINALDENRHEIWIAGDDEPQAQNPTINRSHAVTIRGGFSAVENSAAEREEGKVSEIAGKNVIGVLMPIASPGAVTLERLRLNGAKYTAVLKSGNGALTLDGCTIENSSVNQCNYHSYGGVDLTGGAEMSVLITNCVFRENGCRGQCQGDNDGGSIRAVSIASLEVVDTKFIGNGAPFTMNVGSSSANRGSSGRVILADSTPVKLTRCDFRANRGCTGCGTTQYSQSADNRLKGGIVTLRGACGGSEIVNCAFIGNEDIFSDAGGLKATQSADCGGAIVFRLTDAATTAKVENCTFAYNLSDDVGSPAAVNVRSGCVNVKNSIFHGNLKGPDSTAENDVHYAEGAEGEVSYCLFDTDPLFAKAETMAELVTTNSGLFYFKLNDQVKSRILAVDCHLRSRANGFRGPMSPAIDAGDPTSDYSEEPDVDLLGSNGKRINLGAYGNTSGAAMTPLKGNLLIIK